MKADANADEQRPDLDGGTVTTTAASDVRQDALTDAPTTPEGYCFPAPQVCCEHWSGHGEDGWPECCLCSASPCATATIQTAIEHGKYDYWRGRLAGVYLARQVLSDAIGSAAPADRPLDPPDAAYDAAVDSFHTAWVIVRGDIDEPPF